MKKILFIYLLFWMPSVMFSQVLTQHFAEGEAVKEGVKVSKSDQGTVLTPKGMSVASQSDDHFLHMGSGTLCHFCHVIDDFACLDLQH